MRLRNRDGRFGTLDLAKNEVGKIVAAHGCRRIAGRIDVENEGTSRELITDLIISILPDLAAKAHGMLASDPGNIIDELQGTVVVRVGTFGIVAKAAIAREADRRNSPCHWSASVQTRNRQLLDNVANERKLAAGGVEEAVHTEAKLVYQARSQDARVGAHILFHVREHFEAV